MYENREVFAEPPLALVAAEVRYAYSPRLRRQEELDQIIIALDSRLPVVRPLQNFSVTIGLGGAAQGQAEALTVLTNVANTESLTFGTNSFAFEATDYVDFPAFTDALGLICRAVVDAGVIPLVERIGLRYIDEIRVPEAIKGPLDWAGWVDDSLVDQVSVGDAFAALRSEGLISYSLGGSRGLNFRFAAVDGEPVVGGLLRRRRTPEPGPFFVLDVDAFETYSSDPMVLSPESVIATLKALHDPAGVLFQRAITDKTRNLFRGGDGQ